MKPDVGWIRHTTVTRDTVANRPNKDCSRCKRIYVDTPGVSGALCIGYKQNVGRGFLRFGFFLVVVILVVVSSSIFSNIKEGVFVWVIFILFIINMILVLGDFVALVTVRKKLGTTR